LDPSLDVFNGFGWFGVDDEGLTGKGLYEAHQCSSDYEGEAKGGFILDVVVSEGFAVLKNLASKYESLLVGRDSLFDFYLGLDVFDGVGWYKD
jgi:hypothetical protein